MQKAISDGQKINVLSNVNNNEWNGIFLPCLQLVIFYSLSCAQARELLCRIMALYVVPGLLDLSNVRKLAEYPMTWLTNYQLTFNKAVNIYWPRSPHVVKQTFVGWSISIVSHSTVHPTPALVLMFNTKIPEASLIHFISTRGNYGLKWIGQITVVDHIRVLID